MHLNIFSGWSLLWNCWNIDNFRGLFIIDNFLLLGLAHYPLVEGCKNKTNAQQYLKFFQKGKPSKMNFEQFSFNDTPTIFVKKRLNMRFFCIQSAKCRICLICANFWHSMRSAGKNEEHVDSFASAGDTRETARYNSNEKQENSMNCPNCGSPVTVQGNHWECGWCRDFGGFPPLVRTGTSRQPGT